MTGGMLRPVLVLCLALGPGCLTAATPQMLAHGFALAVPIELGSPGWGEDDLHRVLDLALPTLAEWVDVERPVLIGLSAGSHAALAAWARDPSRWGGAHAPAITRRVSLTVVPSLGHEFVFDEARLAAALSHFQ